MLINTRNFSLYLLLVGVLLVGIAYTVADRWPVGGQEATVIMPTLPADETVTYTATVEGPTLPDRANRVLDMKAKVNEYIKKQLSVDAEPAAPPPASPAEAADSATRVSEEEPPAATELRCPQYVVYHGDWLASGLRFMVSEGARLLYRESPDQLTGADITGLTNPPDVVWQLPLLSQAASHPTCLQTDVVGVAQDGSLIRNNEVRLYSVFGADTLVGYALDGFPIYGSDGEQTLDRCGGTTVAGQYRYLIETGRPYILGCFAGTPIDIH